MRLNGNTPITINTGLTKIPVILIHNRAYTDTRPHSLQSRAHTDTRSLQNRAHTAMTRSLYNRAPPIPAFFSTGVHKDTRRFITGTSYSRAHRDTRHFVNQASEDPIGFHFTCKTPQAGEPQYPHKKRKNKDQKFLYSHLNSLMIYSFAQSKEGSPNCKPPAYR